MCICNVLRFVSLIGGVCIAFCCKASLYKPVLCRSMTI